MKKVKSFEYPQDLVKKFNKAKNLSWITIVTRTIAVETGIAQFYEYEKGCMDCLKDGRTPAHCLLPHGLYLAP
jgi:hypothetical protein